MRPDWGEYFLEVAKAVSLRGDCIRSKVGAVLVDDRTKRILATGFNGSEPGGPSCLLGECPRCLSNVPSGMAYDGCIERHAETNCVDFWRDNALYQDRPTTIYITRAPCGDCQEMLRVMFYVKRAVWPGGEMEL